MTEATRKREGPTPEQLAQRARFERLNCDWHTARAAIDNPDLPKTTSRRWRALENWTKQNGLS